MPNEIDKQDGNLGEHYFGQINYWIIITGSVAIILSHSGISTLMKDNQYQNKNGRDLGIAYFLVFLTYVILGPGSEIIFPKDE